VTTTSIRAAAAYIDSWLAFRQRYLRVPGVQAAILVEDELVLSTAHGHADVASATELTPTHLFRIASHSKTFTATAVMQLVESGAVRLDDPLKSHLPWITGAPKVADISVREVLGHASGLFRDGDDGDFWQLTRPFPDEDELRALITDESAILPPNERFKYSNIGYSLLGLVIAAAAGIPYNDYVTRNIVERLELRDTYPELAAERIADYATGYTGISYRADRIPIDHVDTRGMSAATGFTSTAADVCRYAAAHFFGDDRLIGDASKRLMQHQEWTVDEGGKDGYGLGLGINTVGERRLVGHGGGYPGHSTRTMLDPKERIAVSVLTNAIDGPAQELADGVFKLIDLAEKSTDEPVGADADRFCGRFANIWGVIDIARLGDQLLVLSPARPDPAESPSELRVESDDRLRVVKSLGYGAPGEAYQFDFDGDAVRSINGAGGMTFYPIESFTDQIADRARISATGG